MKDILFFTNNYNKVREINNIFKNYQINILSLKDFNLNHSPIENGKTFAENAKIKSLLGFNLTQLPCFADDSGICIEALNDRPGVFSKKFLNSFKSRENCFNYISRKIKSKKNDKDFFKTSICLTTKLNHHIIFEGKIDGKLSDKPKGKMGFGYDPIFIPEGYSKTFAEMRLSQKNLHSHRSIAIKKLVSFLFN